MRLNWTFASSIAARRALPAMKSDREAAVVQSWGERSVETSSATWIFARSMQRAPAAIWARP